MFLTCFRVLSLLPASQLYQRKINDLLSQTWMDLIQSHLVTKRPQCIFRHHFSAKFAKVRFDIEIFLNALKINWLVPTRKLERKIRLWHFGENICETNFNLCWNRCVLEKWIYGKHRHATSRKLYAYSSSAVGGNPKKRHFYEAEIQNVVKRAYFRKDNSRKDNMNPVHAT